VINFRKNLALLVIIALVLSQVIPNTAVVYGEPMKTTINTAEAPQNGSAKEIIESTYPAANQKDVEVKPTMKIVFKYPVEIKDKTKITLTSGGEEYTLDSTEIYLLDERTLCIDVGRIGKLPLRRGTLYLLTLSKGAVKLKDYDITNDDITIKFVTRTDGQSPKIKAYSSSASGGDDITSLSGTKLSRDGSIYIIFDRNIKLEKNTTKEKLIQEAKLYRILRPKETDEAGNDKAFEFEPGITEADLRKEPYLQEIEVGEVEINSNILRIKPKSPMLNLNQYRLTIKKELIEDINGYALEKDVDFYFWTAASTDKPKLLWETVQGALPGSITDNYSTGGKACTVTGTFAYGPESPIVLIIEGEAIPKAGDISSLKKIALIEGYEPNKAVKISKLRFEYYSEGNVKKTKLLIYPEKALDAGKYYVLTVPAVIQDRSGQFLPRLDLYITVGRNASAPAGISAIEPDTFELKDIYSGTATFTIKGYNFSENIEYISIKLASGENAGTVQAAVYKNDIEFRGITQLEVKLRDRETIKKLVAADGGEYTLQLYFADRTEPVSNESVKLKILSRGKPKVLATDPPGGDTWSNEKKLNAKTIDGTTRYFLKVTFEDFDGSLRFDRDLGLNLLKSSTVYSEGQNEVSMLDTEFITFIQNLEDLQQKDYYISQYIFVKDSQAGLAYLYIPVKLLRSQTTYNVMLNAGMVYFEGDQTNANDTVQWSFTTTANPAVTGIQVGSVVENYDEDVPIILYGDFFDEDNVEVYFNDIRASRVRVGTDENGQSYLMVYLPSGKNKLEPGIYTILVRNDGDHEFEVFGALSVVKQGSHIPNEEYRVKDEYRYGQVISHLQVSEDTLILERPYTYRSTFEVDLDEIMGQQVLTRKIRFDGRRSDRISTLETLSKWANITLYDIGIDDYSSDEMAEVTLGRAEAQVVQYLRQRLGRAKIKSEFIQVLAQNVRFSSFYVTMPFKESDGDKLKVLRYDPNTRQFSKQDFSVNRVEKTVTFRSSSTGIFVVVEE